mgnify:CR=1 FL=1
MNIVLQLQKNNSHSVLDHENVIFDETIHQIGDISYDAGTGVFTILKNGFYIIDWYVAMQTTSGRLARSFS